MIEQHYMCIRISRLQLVFTAPTRSSGQTARGVKATVLESSLERSSNLIVPVHALNDWIIVFFNLIQRATLYVTHVEAWLCLPLPGDVQEVPSDEPGLGVVRVGEVDRVVVGIWRCVIPDRASVWLHSDRNIPELAWEEIELVL